MLSPSLGWPAFLLFLAITRSSNPGSPRQYVIVRTRPGICAGAAGSLSGVSDELGARDLRRALNVVREMNDGCDGELPVAALAGLGALVGCDIAACARIERMTGRTLAVLTDRPNQSVMHNPE